MANIGPASVLTVLVLAAKLRLQTATLATAENANARYAAGCAAAAAAAGGAGQQRRRHHRCCHRLPLGGS